MAPNDDNFDAAVDLEIAECLSLEKPVSFFVFAGAGSGKTRSLVSAIRHVQTVNDGACRKYLSLHAKYLGVITFTKAATDEIRKRAEFDPVVRVSTIHSFAWALIGGFNEDIRNWLSCRLRNDLVKLGEEQSKARSATNKTSIDRLRRMESKRKRLERLPYARTFTYNPDGENEGRDSLAHSEVIGIAADLLAENEVMQRILVGRFPFLLIDESQDTSAKLMEAFFKVQAKYKDRFALGLFGDTMQRIYFDGKSDLGEGLPADWCTPIKKMNHRCPPRIVELINKVRLTIDGQQQRSRRDRTEGLVRLFVTRTGGDGRAIEKQVAQKMAEITGESEWMERLGVKRLILEHHMASSREGFTEMFKPLYDVDKLRSGVLDGSLSGVQFFARYLLPIVEGNELLTTAMIRGHSPLLDKRVLRQDEKLRGDAMERCRAAVAKVTAVCGRGKSPTFGELLLLVAEGGLFAIPQSLRFFVGNDGEAAGEVESESEPEEDRSRLLEAQYAWEGFLSAPFSQLRPYLEYVNGEGGFDTHQGVKGLEFPRVMVIMDDGSARGWQFSYDGLFGAKDSSPSNKPKEDPDRTKRLFYVTCSRAEKALALVAYSANPPAVVANVTANGWFTTDEVVRL